MFYVSLKLSYFFSCLLGPGVSSFHQKVHEIVHILAFRVYQSPVLQDMPFQK